MDPITKLQKTAWYLVINEDGDNYTDDQGHMWFSERIAMRIGRELGIMPTRCACGGLKNVVVR